VASVEGMVENRPDRPGDRCLGRAGGEVPADCLDGRFYRRGVDFTDGGLGAEILDDRQQAALRPTLFDIPIGGLLEGGVGRCWIALALRGGHCSSSAVMGAMVGWRCEDVQRSGGPPIDVVVALHLLGVCFSIRRSRPKL